MAALAGGEPGGNLLRLAGGAAGNPLYLTELVAALARSSSVTITAAELRADGRSAPGSLSAAIADRSASCPGRYVRYCGAAALLGVDFAVPDLAIVLGRSVTDLFPGGLRGAGCGRAGRVRQAHRFRHPLIRAALYDEIPEPVRAAWHREAGRALAEAGAPADRVARQCCWRWAAQTAAAGRRRTDG